MPKKYKSLRLETKMINTAFLLSAIKSKHCATSDYRLAKLLDVTATTIYKYKKRDDKPSDITLSKVSELLSVPPHVLYAAIQHERAKDASSKLVWAEAYRVMGGPAIEKRLIKECFSEEAEKAEA
jgi:DNA-binding XRE family transcriptional regulator